APGGFAGAGSFPTKVGTSPTDSLVGGTSFSTERGDALSLMRWSFPRKQVPAGGALPEVGLDSFTQFTSHLAGETRWCVSSRSRTASDRAKSTSSLVVPCGGSRVTSKNGRTRG